MNLNDMSLIIYKVFQQWRIYKIQSYMSMHHLFTIRPSSNLTACQPSYLHHPLLTYNIWSSQVDKPQLNTKKHGKLIHLKSERPINSSKWLKQKILTNTDFIQSYTLYKQTMITIFEGFHVYSRAQTFYIVIRILITFWLIKTWLYQAFLYN